MNMRRSDILSAPNMNNRPSNVIHADDELERRRRRNRRRRAASSSSVKIRFF